jgi:hypothetical protein
MSDNILIFLFLYEELNTITNNVISFIDNNKITEIIQMKINKDDNHTRQWLLNNEKNLKIDKFPVFLISQTGRNTEVRNGTIPEAKNIQNIIKKITN